MSDSPYYAGVPIWIPYPDGTGYAAGTVDKVDSTNSTHTSDPEERLGVHLVLDDPTILPSLSSSSKESQNPDIFTWYFPVAILTGAGNSSKLQPSSISPTLGGSNTAWGGLPLVGKDVDGKPVPLPPLREPHRDVLEDLAELTALNEANVLHEVERRYEQRLIYTYSGIVLLSLNPFSKLQIYDNDMIQMYAGKAKRGLEPHIYAIAEEALSLMRRKETTHTSSGVDKTTGVGDQIIIVSGESGAGKTYTSKQILRFFSSVDDPDKPHHLKKSRGRGPATKDEVPMTEIERKILSCNPILEAVGNAKTLRNDNSSRFGRLLIVNFSNDNEIIGARITTYLLERSRLANQTAGERNFHIFYQLMAGAGSAEKQAWKLEGKTPADFAYLAGGGPDSVKIPGVDDEQDFKATMGALSEVGIGLDTQLNIFKILASLLHLGNIKIGGQGKDASVSDDDEALINATTLLGIEKQDFRKWLTKKMLVTRTDRIVTSLNIDQAHVVRDSVSKFIYSSLFDWLVWKINGSLAGDGLEVAHKFIGVLDIYGFEHFKVNSFEQFCINWANEKLQQEFNGHVFKLEQDEYVREQITWDRIEFADNQGCIDVIENKLGVLGLLDEESRLPAGADDSFAEKLYQNISKPEQQEFFKKPRFGKSEFTIKHYAHDVSYNVSGFIEKNRDTVPEEHLELLKISKNEMLVECIMTSLEAAEKAGEASSARLSAKKGTEGSAANGAPSAKTVARGATSRKPTLGTIFKGSLKELMTTIGSTNVHYIRCIKPNESKAAWQFEPKQVLSQLQACGVLETIRISNAGYPNKLEYNTFVDRYCCLLDIDTRSKVYSGEITPQDALPQILQNVPEQGEEELTKKGPHYQLGKTKIFFRAGQLALLDAKMEAKKRSAAIDIQKNLKMYKAMNNRKEIIRFVVNLGAHCRRLLAVARYNDRKREKAAITIQTAARGFLARSTYKRTKAATIKIQSFVRMHQARKDFVASRDHHRAIALQRLLRGVAARDRYNTTRKHIIHLQACYRRRMARRELAALRKEAKSVSHHKEKTYALENKVVELTQINQKRAAEVKSLSEMVSSLEKQVESWTAKHSDAQTKHQELNDQLDTSHVQRSQYDLLLSEKQELDSQLQAALERERVSQSEIERLTKELSETAWALESAQTTVETNVIRSNEDSTTISSLQSEVAALKEQINRASALQALNGRTRSNSITSPTLPNGTLLNGKYPSVAKKPTRRASVPERDVVNGHDRSSSDEFPQGPRPTTIAISAEDTRFLRDSQGMPLSEDDRAEHIKRLLQDEQALDEDVLNGLIRGLKPILPSLNNPPSYVEVMFPAHVIIMITNRMWGLNMIKESERFLANVMQTIQDHVTSFEGEDAIIPGIFWLSNIHELLSFAITAEEDAINDIGPSDELLDWEAYTRLVTIVRHDLDNLEYNIYHTFMQEVKRKLYKMIIPAVVESQALPGFQIQEGSGRLFNRMLGISNNPSQPAYSMDDILNLLNKVWKALKSYYMEDNVVDQVVTDLLKLIGVTAFNDVLMRRNFCSWKRAMQIQYNITRIEEWCKTHGMQDGILQLESLIQATKLLQLKKATPTDIDILFDVCWILSPSQIQKFIAQYHVADYETPISSEILKLVATRVNAESKGDHLLLPPETEEAGPYTLPPRRDIDIRSDYIPPSVQVDHVRRIILRSL